MRQHTSAFRNKIKEHGRELDSVITFTSNNQTIVLGNEDLNMITPQFMGSILKSVMRELTIDSNVEIPKNTILNYKLGVKVRNDEVVDYRDNYDYVDFGNYIVKEVNELVDTHSYEIKCYDKMLLAMKDYESLNVTYPISVKNYLTAICTKLGLTLATQSFVNDSVTIKREHFLTDDNKTLGYTYRDVLDEIAGATASTICINEDDEVEVRYITETNETFDEEYLKDIDIKFKEEYGPVNTIVLSRSAETDNIYRPTTLPANPIELKIKDNDLLNDDDRVDYIDGIYNKLNGLRYYSNDIRSTGICYLDVCDRYTIQIGNDTYSCVMFDDSIDVTTGLVENITTDIPESSVTDYTKADKTDRSINQASLIVDKQQASITLAVSTANDAKTTAQSASSTASSALSTAQSASSTASSAQSTANTANTNANTAIGQLSLKIDKGDTGEVISAFNLNSNQVVITSDNFTLDAQGNMTANNGSFKGRIESTDGLIGNWYISTTGLSSSYTTATPPFSAGDILYGTSLAKNSGQYASTIAVTKNKWTSSTSYNTYDLFKVYGSGETHMKSLNILDSGDTNNYSTTLSPSDNHIGKASHPVLRLDRTDGTYASAIQFKNTNGILGSIGMTGNTNTLAKRWNSDSSQSWDIIDRSVVTSTTTKNSTNVMTSGGVFSAFGSMLSVLEVDINVGTILANDEQYDKTYSYSIGSGYTALGIVGFYISGSNYTRLFCNKLNCDSSNIYWSLRNSSNLNTTNVHLVVKILRVKTS